MPASAYGSEFEILEVLPVGIFILDRSLRVAFVNETMENYFGISRSRLIGRYKPALVQEQIRHIIQEGDEFARRLLASYENNTYPEQFRCRVLAGRNRRARWLEHRSKPITTGPYTGGRSELYTDITAQVESEQEREFLHNQIMLIQEREKARLAQDLHDGLGQSVVAVKLMLEELECGMAARGIQDPACHRLRDIISYVERLSHEVRAISFDLTPSMLRPLGLTETIAWMVDHCADLYNLTIDFTSHGLSHRRLPDAVETQLFRIFQEALNNVVKHARASEVQVRLVYTHPTVILTVKDNGQGFNRNTAFEGLGIKSMERRAQQLGGRFKLVSGSGRGTTVRVEVPVEEGGHGEDPGVGGRRSRTGPDRAYQDPERSD